MSNDRALPLQPTSQIAAYYARTGLKPPSSPAAEPAAARGEDPVAVEKRRITEQLREQGRR
jgi:hypothetical protein